MKYITVSFVAILTSLSACSPADKGAVESSGSAEQIFSYSSFEQQDKAQSIVARAMENAGGLEALKVLTEGQMTFSTRAARVGQATTPDANGDLGNPSKTIAQRANGRVAIDRFNGETLGSRYVHGGLVDWIHFTGPNTVADVDPILAGGIINQANTSAHSLLAMSETPQNIRFVGTNTKKGKTFDVVTFVNSVGQMQSAHFDRANGELHKIETLTAHAQWGDIAISRVFSDYKTLNNVRVAHTATTKQSDVITSIVTLEGFNPVAVSRGRISRWVVLYRECSAGL